MTRTYTDGQRSRSSVSARATRSTPTPPGSCRARREAEARAPSILSLRYGLPTFPFVARERAWPRRRPGLIDESSRASTRTRRPAPAHDARPRRRASAPRAGELRGPPAQPRRSPSAATGAGGRRCTRLAAGGRDPRCAQRSRRSASRSATRRRSWTLETCFKDFRRSARFADRIGAHVDVPVRYVGAARRRRCAGSGDSLPFMHAGVGPPGHGDVHRGRRLRHRRVGRAGRARPARSTTSTSRARTTSSPTGSSPTTRSTASAARTSRNILDFQDDYPDADGRQARAELPLDADDPRRGQRGHLAQPRADAQDAVDRPRRGRPDQGPRARRRARRGAVRRRARSSGWSTRASRARRSRSSTGPTRSRGCSRTRSCAARSATRSSAARSSTSARRSRTRSPT